MCICFTSISLVLRNILPAALHKEEKTMGLWWSRPNTDKRKENRPATNGGRFSGLAGKSRKAASQGEGEGGSQRERHGSVRRSTQQRDGRRSEGKRSDEDGEIQFGLPSFLPFSPSFFKIRILLFIKLIFFSRLKMIKS